MSLPLLLLLFVQLSLLITDCFTEYMAKLQNIPESQINRWCINVLINQ